MTQNKVNALLLPYYMWKFSAKCQLCGRSVARNSSHRSKHRAPPDHTATIEHLYPLGDIRRLLLKQDEYTTLSCHKCNTESNRKFQESLNEAYRKLPKANLISLLQKSNTMSALTQNPTKSDAARAPFDENIISSIVINGDISKLSPNDKVSYYRQFCERIGLDPISQPFKLLKLNGKEVLYCGREGAQQLNKVHKVSHDITARETVSGCYVVTAMASTPDGRHTTSIGAVAIDNLRGESLCNAMMKSETKAKRRATLDLLGLGILDETETDSIPGAQKIDLTDGQGGSVIGASGSSPVIELPEAMKPAAQTSSALPPPKDLMPDAEALKKKIIDVVTPDDLTALVAEVKKLPAGKERKAVSALMGDVAVQKGWIANEQTKKYELAPVGESAKVQDLDWFCQRIGKQVWCEKADKSEAGPLLIEDDAWPPHCVSNLQAVDGYLFRDLTPAEQKEAEQIPA